MASRASRIGLLAVAVALTASILPASTVHGSTSEPASFSTFGAMAVDDAHGHVLATDVGSALVVADDSGTLLQRIQLPDVKGLAISPSLGEAFAAQPPEHQIAVIDTATLTVTRVISTGSIEPAWLAMAGGRLWMSDATQGSSGDIASIDPSAPNHPPVVEADVDSSSEGAYLMSGGESETGLALSGDPLSDDTEGTWLGAVSGSTFTVLSSDDGTGLVTYAFSSTGLVTAASDNINIGTSTFPGLSSRGVYDVETTDPVGGCDSPQAAYSADGKWLVAGDAPTVYQVGTAQPYRQSPSIGCMPFNGLALSADSTREFAVAHNSDDSLTLHVLAGPESSTPAPLQLWPGLGMQTVDDMTIDNAHDHGFITPGLSGNDIDVVDFNGKVVKRIPGMYGATMVALDPQLHEAFVALESAGQFAVIDTDTLQVLGRRDTSPSSTDETLALAGGRLWFWNPQHLVSVPADQALTAPETSAGVPSDEIPQTIEGAGPDSPYLIGITLPFHLSLFRATGATLTRTTTSEDVQDAVFSRDGTDFFTASRGGNTVQEHRSDTGAITRSFTFPSSFMPQGLAVSDDGKDLVESSSPVEIGGGTIGFTDLATGHTVIGGNQLETAVKDGLGVSADNQTLFDLHPGLTPTLTVLPGPASPAYPTVGRIATMSRRGHLLQGRIGGRLADLGGHLTNIPTAVKGPSGVIYLTVQTHHRLYARTAHHRWTRIGRTTRCRSISAATVGDRMAVACRDRHHRVWVATQRLRAHKLPRDLRFTDWGGDVSSAPTVLDDRGRLAVASSTYVPTRASNITYERYLGSATSQQICFCRRPVSSQALGITYLTFLYFADTDAVTEDTAGGFNGPGQINGNMGEAQTQHPTNQPVTIVRGRYDTTDVAYLDTDHTIRYAELGLISGAWRTMHLHAYRGLVTVP